MNGATKIWLGVGAYLLASTSPGALLTGEGPSALLSVTAALAKAGGEGGEGGEGGGPPPTYKLDSVDPNALAYDARPQIAGYAALVHAAYKTSHEQAVKMQAVIGAFLRNPNPANLANARAAWVEARKPYLETEVFRFYDGPIDYADYTTGLEGPEGEINAWPLNEAFIDYVQGDPKAGLINNRKFPINAATIRRNDQLRDEADVTTGWHAIEFLLWGQDLSATGPGDRPVGDYKPGIVVNDRRRLYLKTLTAMLTEDLEGLVAAWAPGRADNYAAKFLALDQREALGRMLAGMGTLTGLEMMSERLTVPLDSGDQEDEHSCFSDTTYNDFVHDMRGVGNVWSAGLNALIASRDASLGARVDGLMARATAAIAEIPQPFDQMLASPKGSPARAKAEAAAVALKDLAESLKDVGANLGVLVVVPTPKKKA